MRPEKIDDKFVSYATGQLQSASPLDKWAIEACSEVRLLASKNKWISKY